MRTFLLFTSSDGLRTERDITYDRNGNVTGVDRFKNASYERETLEFTLSGNRVTDWTDNYATDQGSYGYDAAGNLASDSHKGLLFSYNLANLPSKVEGVGYNAGLTYSYGYLSDGTKTSADSGSGSTAQGLRYRGSFVYETLGGEVERLQSISWPEGRIVLEYDGNDTEPCLVSYDWLVTDHVGSVRAIAGMRTGFTGVKEVNGYLPFGTRLPGTLQSSGNRHRFGGKEEQRIGSTDLKLLDFGARYYDAFACRWTSLDPLAGKYPAITPYSYCAGNPVFFYDPNGEDRIVSVRGNTIHVYASYYVPNVKYDDITALDAFNKAASFLNNYKGLKYIKAGKTYKVRFHVDVVNKYQPAKEAKDKEGSNYVEVDSSPGYRKDKNGNNILGGSDGGKKVTIHNKHLGQIGVILQEMLHSMGAALKPGPNGEDPHEETGLMTQTEGKQTMVITQKTVNDIIEYGNENIE